MPPPNCQCVATPPRTHVGTTHAAVIVDDLSRVAWLGAVRGNLSATSEEGRDFKCPFQQALIQERSVHIGRVNHGASPSATGCSPGRHPQLPASVRPGAPSRSSSGHGTQRHRVYPPTRFASAAVAGAPHPLIAFTVKIRQVGTAANNRSNGQRFALRQPTVVVKPFPRQTSKLTGGCEAFHNSERHRIGQSV